MTHRGETITLEWGDYQRSVDSWSIVQWGGGRIWDIGVGVQVGGVYEEASAAELTPS